MKIKSALLTQASGSIGGMTASRNRGGMYLRSRVVPVNPNTEAQGIARENMATAVAAWNNTLTDVQRQAWQSYAAATPTVDKLGDQLILSGQQMFTKNTTRRLIAGLAIIAAGPVEAGLGNTPQFDVDPQLDADTGLDLTVSVADAGITGDLMVYISEPTPLSRSLAHAKRRFAVLDGPPVAGVFTATAAAAALPYSPVSGMAARITVVYLGDDGRVSAEAFRDVVITP